MRDLLNSLKPTPIADAPCVGIYTTRINNRLNYVCGFIFEQVFKIKFELITNEQTFDSWKGIKINLTDAHKEKCIQIKINDFIYESGIKKDHFTLKNQHNTWHLVRKNELSNQDNQLDIFSSVFYFISRYEEWQNPTLDVHSRFELKASLAYLSGLHLSPIVDIWLHDFKKTIGQYFPQQTLPSSNFRIISTIDVDNVFAFKHKGALRTLGAYAKDLLRVDFKNMLERTKVLLSLKKDPFDVYEEVSAFCNENQIPLIFFFLLNNGNKYDRSIDPDSKAFEPIFQKLINAKANIGIHPSYYSSNQNGLLANEKSKLEKKANQEIIFSRQHYLRFDIKTSPPLLMKNGIKADFTMGYASSPGFRAGTSYPFYYYDFQKDQVGDLLMVPFCAMDGAYTVYENTKAQDAFNELQKMAQEIKTIGGYFILVYHERSFYNHLYKDFGDLYKKIHLSIK